MGMRTNVRESSIECFHGQQARFDKQSQQIIDYIKANPTKAFTRREIAVALSIDTSSVAGRVNKLVTDKELHELPRRKCSISKIMAHTLMIPRKQPEQTALFE
jgi:hypothetical protein